MLGNTWAYQAGELAMASARLAWSCGEAVPAAFTTAFVRMAACCSTRHAKNDRPQREHPIRLTATSLTHLTATPSAVVETSKTPAQPKKPDTAAEKIHAELETERIAKKMAAKEKTRLKAKARARRKERMAKKKSKTVAHIKTPTLSDDRSAPIKSPGSRPSRYSVASAETPPLSTSTDDWDDNDAASASDRTSTGRESESISIAEESRYLEPAIFGQIYAPIQPKDFGEIRSTIMNLLNRFDFVTYQVGTSVLFPREAQDCDLWLISRIPGESVETAFARFAASPLFRDGARPLDNLHHMTPLVFTTNDGRRVKLDVTCKPRANIREYLADQPLNVSAVVRNQRRILIYANRKIENSIARGELLLTNPAHTSHLLHSYFARINIRNSLNAVDATAEDKFVHQHLAFILKHTQRFLSRCHGTELPIATVLAKTDPHIQYLLGALVHLDVQRSALGLRITTGIHNCLRSLQELDANFVRACQATYCKTLGAPIAYSPTTPFASERAKPTDFIITPQPTP